MPNNYKGNSQAVTRREHDLEKEAKRTILTDPFGGEVTEGNFTTYMDYDENNNPIYIGKAQIGTTTDSALWQIKKLNWTGSNLTSIQWAEGTDDFTNVWDDRSGLSYS